MQMSVRQSADYRDGAKAMGAAAWIARLAEGSGNPEDGLAVTAYHEAGHAVVAHVLNIACSGITLRSDDDPLGGVSLADPWLILDVWDDARKFRDEESAFLARILATMAGGEAEAMFCGSFRFRNDGDQSEIAGMLQAWSAARRARGAHAEVERHRERMRTATRIILRRHSRKVHRLAGELMRRGALRSTEVETVLART